MGGARGPAPPPPSRRGKVGELPSPGRSWARSIVERRGEARAEHRRPRSPPGRSGCTWPAPQPGCGGRPRLAGSAAAPGTCALAQTARDHEPDRPRLLLHAQLLRKCRPRLRRAGDPDAGCTRRPSQGRPLRSRISAHPPYQGPWQGKGHNPFSFLDLL